MAKNSGATTQTKSDNLLPVARRGGARGGGAVYARLREELRSSVIAVGLPGARVPSERALARQFGVSPLTVSRAMQELQNEGVIERIVGKGSFIAHAVAPEPQGAESGLERAAADEWNWGLGERAPAPVATAAPFVWIVASLGAGTQEPHAREYWSHRLTSHLERRVQKSGGRTIISDQENTAPDEIAATGAAMVASGVNSVIFLVDGPHATTKSWIHQMLRERERGNVLAVTQVSFGNGARFPLDTVRFDGEQGAYLATAHLLELGHREIAFLAPSPQTPWLADRIEGFERALEMAGLQARPDRIFQPATPLSGAREPVARAVDPWGAAAREVGPRLLEARRFTAVVAANDRMATTLVELASARGLSVPGDLSVVGFDDWHSSKTLGLTTIHPPIEAMGEAATQLALQRPSHPFDGGHVEVVLDPALVVRSSTRKI